MKKILSFLLTLVILVGCVSAFAVAFPFTDVKQKDWFYSYVKAGWEQGLVKGKTETTFDPNGSVSVAEAITFGARIDKILDGEETEFAVTTPWYSAYVDYAIEQGIITKGQFDSYTRKATRAEFAAILAHATFGSDFEIKADAMVPDVKLSDKYGNEIYALYSAKIVKGSDAKGTFYPNNTIKRSECVTILTNITGGNFMHQKFSFDVVSAYREMIENGKISAAISMYDENPTEFTIKTVYDAKAKSLTLTATPFAFYPADTESNKSVVVVFGDNGLEYDGTMDSTDEAKIEAFREDFPQMEQFAMVYAFLLSYNDVKTAKFVESVDSEGRNWYDATISMTDFDGLTYSLSLITKDGELLGASIDCGNCHFAVKPQ